MSFDPYLFTNVQAVHDAGGVEAFIDRLWRQVAEILGDRVAREGDRAENMMAMEDAIQEAIERSLLPDVSRDLQAASAAEEDAVRERYDRIAGSLMSRMLREGPRFPGSD